MDIEDKMRITIDEARKSLVNRECPIGAVVFNGDEIISRAHWSVESTLEFVPHAEMVALLKADTLHYLPSERKKMQLFTTLELCMMCLGAGMSFYIGEIYYALESPIDGATDFAIQFWRESRKEMPSYGLPAIYGGLLKSESQDILREYINVVPNGLGVEFCKTLITL